MPGSDEPQRDSPPRDPYDWTEEQWIEWLNDTDAEAGDAEGPVTALGRATRSAGGAALGQAMLGMANAIYGRENVEVVIVTEGNSTPESDEPFAIHLDPEHPERTVVVVRDDRASPPETDRSEDLE